MSEQIGDGGPAFPAPPSHLSCGMSMRDYFAAKAMQAIVESVLSNPTRRGLGTKLNCDCVALDSFEIADAMLKARGGWLN
jgi:hypothetical protein